jgi:hypothetical protein
MILHRRAFSTGAENNHRKTLDEYWRSDEPDVANLRFTDEFAGNLAKKTPRREPGRGKSWKYSGLV